MLNDGEENERAEILTNDYVGSWVYKGIGKAEGAGEKSLVSQPHVKHFSSKSEA